MLLKYTLLSELNTQQTDHGFPATTRPAHETLGLFGQGLEVENLLHSRILGPADGLCTASHHESAPWMEHHAR
jgi:hypothetical protein